jgi:formiminotetrahydrofolate cyclodeaminase
VSQAADDGLVAHLDLPLSAFLSALAAAEPAPSGGGAAAVTVALGASLCAMAARLSARQLTQELASELTTEAERLRDRSASLIQADADSYQRVLAERRSPAGAGLPATASSSPAGAPDASSSPAGAPAERQHRIAAALSAASAVPMDIMELAACVVRLAARLAADGNPNLRGDVLSAAELAAGGARAAAVLVAINLAGAPDDERHALADRILAEIARCVPASPGSVSMITEDPTRPSTSDPP